MDKLQIVALNIPYPPNYGGVIDIFYKIKALYKLGVKITLHCFEYDRPQTPELESYCEQIYYYERKKLFADFLSSTPFIVKSRNHPELIENLVENKAPILFEGLHTCWYLNHPRLTEQAKIVRTHNIEHDYYKALERSTKNLPKRFFFRREAKKLRRYESVLEHAQALACISPDDTKYFESAFGNAHFIPAFHSFEKVSSKVGRGDYILFHGNLSVEENIKALDFIIDEVKPQLEHHLIVAGKSPSPKLRTKVAGVGNCSLVENPTDEKMQTLIANAHICLIPSFQDTGLKLKLLASLFAGRFIVTTTDMVSGSGLEHLCRVGQNATEVLRIVEKTMGEVFTNEEVELRKEVLERDFSNEAGARKLTGLFGGSY